MNEEQVRQIIRQELAFMVKNKKLVFPYPMQILDGNDITIGQTVGTRIGSSGSKIALFGKTPIVQYPTGYLLQPTGGATIDDVARARIQDINVLLAAFGFAYDVT